MGIIMLIMVLVKHHKILLTMQIILTALDVLN